MSKVRLLILALSLPLFLIAVYGLGTYVKQRTAKAASGPEILTPTPFVAGISDTQDTALLTKETGDVQYKLPNAESFVSLDSNEVKVPTGTSVKTGDESLAHVVFPNNSLMSLSKNTEIVLNFEDGKINIFQILGNTWHRVEKVLQGQSYTVETPTTLATVRGTEFNVGMLPDGGAEVYVMESVVDVSKIAKTDGEMKIEETKKVEKDKHIFLKKADAEKPMQVVDLPANKKNTAWFKRNTKITEEIKKAEEEMQKKEGQDPAEVGKAPEHSQKMDALMHQVRESVMQKIKEDKTIEKELKTIDETFAPTPSQGTQGQVRGASTTVLNNLPNVELKTNNKTGQEDKAEIQNTIERVIPVIQTPVPTSSPAEENSRLGNTLNTGLGLLLNTTSESSPTPLQ